MISRAIIKQNAKFQLGNNLFGTLWLMAILILIIESALLSLAGSTGIVAIIITGPLSVGVTSVFVNLLRGKDRIDIEDMFSGFTTSFGRNLLVGFLTSLFTILWSLLFVIPGIVKAYSYSMSFYIANEHPEYDWRTCVNESRRLTNGHKMDLFILDLSFIGWYIVGVICLGIGTLWVAPYHYASKVNYYDAIYKLDGMNTESTVNDIPNE